MLYVKNRKNFRVLLTIVAGLIFISFLILLSIKYTSQVVISYLFVNILFLIIATDAICIILLFVMGIIFLIRNTFGIK